MAKKTPKKQDKKSGETVPVTPPKKPGIKTQFRQSLDASGAREVAGHRSPVEQPDSEDPHRQSWREYVLPYCERESEYHNIGETGQTIVREAVVDRLYGLRNLSSLAESDPDKLATLTKDFIVRVLADEKKKTDKAKEELKAAELPKAISAIVYSEAEIDLKDMAGEDYGCISSESRNALIRDCYDEAVNRKADPKNVRGFMQNLMEKRLEDVIAEENPTPTATLEPVKSRYRGLKALGLCSAVILGAVGVSYTLKHLKTDSPEVGRNTRAVGKLEGEMTEVKTKVEGVEARVTAVEGDVKYLKTGQEKLAVKVAGIPKATGEVISEQLEEVKEGVAGVRQEVVEVKKDVKKLGVDYKKLEGRVEKTEDWALDNDYRLMQVEKGKKPTPVPAKPKKDPAQELLDELLAEEATKPSEKPVEQPAEKPTLYNPNETDNWKITVSPYAGILSAHKAKEKPDDMTVYGLEFGAQKGRFSARLGLNYGSDSKQEDGTVSGMDWRGELDYDLLEARLLFMYDLLKNDKFSASVGAGPRIGFETADGYLEMATPLGTVREDIHDSNTIFGGDLSARLEWTPTKNFGLWTGYDYGFNADDDDSNVSRQGLFRIGAVFKF